MAPTRDAAPRRSGRQLIVVLRDPGDQSTLDALRRITSTALRPVFPIRGETAVPNLSGYYYVEMPDKPLEELMASIRRLPGVAGAYVKPSTDVTGRVRCWSRLQQPPANTPDFTRRQKYLGPAPRGIDARYAWTKPGGRGEGVQIVDVEKAWDFYHEELRGQWGVVGGNQINDVNKRNHGTSVLGMLGANSNGSGVTGICWGSRVGGVGIFDASGVENIAGAISQAAQALRPGDLILLELHRSGPRYNFKEDDDRQLGYIPVEWWPDDFFAIYDATSRGIIVVEAAGNGRENLDDQLYDTPASGFPQNWRNPFRRTNWDSGAILVGAGIPPSSQAGRDRSRLKFSNFGSMLDAQGWGLGVTTSGCGDLQGGMNEDRWYTRWFGGTSSASAMVVGAIACAQGILRNAGKPLYTPASARVALRATGSPQQPGPGVPTIERIGNRPDLKQLIAIWEP